MGVRIDPRIDAISNDFMAQAELLSREQLISIISTCLRQQQSIKTFGEENGFNILTAFLGSEQLNSRPRETTRFPEQDKAQVVIDILRTIDPMLFKYCYEDLHDSKLVTWINFMALFPINLCPR